MTNHRELPVSIEIRWQVGEGTAPFEINFKQLWNRAEAISLDGVNTQSLDSHDRLLVLTYHGTKHFWQRLKIGGPC